MKIVKESLYNFHKNGDVKSGLNIGIRAQISAWLEEMDVKNYIINDDLTIDVNGDVELQNKGISKFPLFIRFRKVRGNFFCGHNKLTNLTGAPKEVWGTFGCSYNRLTTLDGAPNKVGGIFRCVHNFKKFTEKEIKEICEVKRIAI